mmetsp:Transcript_6957/g.10571  ORF Transcript_6957/g.10571 Transcript_6957/m.10571 type:complete len:542 (-) Transcript_6957:7-1632(-)
MISAHRNLYRISKIVQQVHSNEIFSRHLVSSSDGENVPLLSLHGAEISGKINGVSIEIQNPDKGGHVILGRNGSGKTKLSDCISSFGRGLLEGKFESNNDFSQSSIALVSFESHWKLLEEGGTTYRAISGGSNVLNNAAKFLVVRFGLYPLLHREVHTLSTGEIRKVLLVQALAKRPKLLVLDNAFDGLDVLSRQSLKELVSKTLKGFRPDILVQGIHAHATAHTQILLSTHRPEEIVDEIKHVSYWAAGSGMFTSQSRDGRSGETLMRNTMGMEASLLHEPWDDSSLPSLREIGEWWGNFNINETTTIVQSRGLCIQDSKQSTSILKQLNWGVKQGERWFIGGSNGSGKSTLSKLLISESKGENAVTFKSRKIALSGHLRVHKPHENGLCSTEIHMALAKSNLTSIDIIQRSKSNNAQKVARWLRLSPEILDKKFKYLSQGQQKMVLIAAAIAKRPKLLVLDEPCQGLDWSNRRLMLGLVERLCRVTNISLVYITHHFEEESLPCITHVLHLKSGTVTYNGCCEDYDSNAAEKVEMEVQL